MGVNEASTNFGIPCTTLRRRIAKNNVMKERLGHSSTFGTENERKIATHIKKLQAYGFAPFRDDVRKMAYNLAEQLNIKHKFNKLKGRAGYDWLQSFLHRNTDLSVRKSEGLSMARVEGMSLEHVNTYFGLLQNVLDENDLSSSDEEISEIILDESGESEMEINNYECVGCGENYNKTMKREEWLQYVVCLRWLHEGCTKFNNICGVCAKFVLKKEKIT